MKTRTDKSVSHQIAARQPFCGISLHSNISLRLSSVFNAPGKRHSAVIKPPYLTRKSVELRTISDLATPDSFAGAGCQPVADRRHLVKPSRSYNQKSIILYYRTVRIIEEPSRNCVRFRSAIALVANFCDTARSASGGLWSQVVAISLVCIQARLYSRTVSSLNSPFSAAKRRS